MAIQRRFQKATRSKYGSRRVEIDGIKFDSAGEAECYGMLKQMQQCGLISELKLQPKVYLSAAKILYKPDFQFFDSSIKGIVYADFKGMETDVWRIKRRLWKAYSFYPLRVYKKQRGSIVLVDMVPGYGMEAPLDLG